MENPPFEDVFPIQDGDFPASYVCLPEGIFFCKQTFKFCLLGILAKTEIENGFMEPKYLSFWM